MLGLDGNKTKTDFGVLQDTEILELAMCLGGINDLPKNFIVDAKAHSDSLHGLRAIPAARHIARVTNSNELIDNSVLSGVFERPLKLQPLESSGYITPDNTSEYYRLALTWESNSRNIRKRFLRYFTEEDLSGLSITQQSGVALILFQEYITSKELKPPLLEVFKKVSNFLIIYPPYLTSLPEKKQNSFFKLWFESQANNKELTNKNSYLWIHLLKYFGELEVIQDKLQQVGSTQTTDTTSENAIESLEQVPPTIEVFSKYLSSEHYAGLEVVEREIKTMLSHLPKGLDSYLAQNIGGIELEVDKLNKLLVGVTPEIVIEVTRKAYTMKTLYQLFKKRESNSKEETISEILEYSSAISHRETSFTETIFFTVLAAYGDIELGVLNIKKSERQASLILPLLNPVFFQKYNGSEGYFQWWFQQLDGEMKTDIEDKDSDLWKYLKAHFFRIKTVEEKFRILEGKSINEAQEKEEIPLLEDQEIKTLLGVFGAPTHLLTDISMLINNLKGHFNPQSNTPNTNNPIASIYGNFKNIRELNLGNKGDLGTIYIAWNTLSIEDKKNILKQLKPHGSMEVLDRGMMALILIKDDVIHLKSAKEHAARSGLALLMYPHFLNSINPVERDTFFTVFFELYGNRDDIISTDSSIWSILLRYFGDNEVVQSNHAKSNSAWNELNRADLLGSIDLEISHSKILRLGSEPEVEEGKTVHVAIYERSQKGNNFRNPKFYTQDDIISGKVILDGPRYSYKAFIHRNNKEFATQNALPDEVKAANPIFLKREKKEAPTPERNNGSKEGSGVEKPKDTEERNLNSFIPDNIEINGNRIILSFDSTPIEDATGETVEYEIGEDGSARLINYFGDTEHTIDTEVDSIFRMTFEVDIEVELERRENIALEIREEKQRLAKERKERKVAEEAVKREEKAKQRATRESQRAREDIISGGGFGKILNDGLDFLHETDTSSRFIKDASTSKGVTYWRLNPSDAIVGRITTLADALGFKISLDYDMEDRLSHISLNSKEHGFANYSGEDFPARLLSSDISPYGNEIAEELVNRIIGVLFKYNFTQDKKNKKKVAETSKKVTQRKELTKATNVRLSKGQALAAMLPITDEKTGKVHNVNWDARKDFGFVGISGSKHTRTLEEVKEAKLGILGKGGLLRAGGSQVFISEDKSEENCNNIINHIRSDESEFMLDYLFRRIFHTLEYFEEKVERSEKPLKKPKIILGKDSFTRFHEDARKVIDAMRLKLDDDVTPEAAKEICISVLQEFKKRKVLLAIVQPKVFSVGELAYS